MLLRVIDIETTGAKPSEIIEIAAVDVVRSDAGWTALPPRSRLFRPRGAISYHAMAVHHLTDEDFADTLAYCSEKHLVEFLSEGGPADALVAHNAAFEAAHISPVAAGGLDWICTVKSARVAWLNAPGYSNQVLRYWRALNLDPALAMPPHRAAPDAWVTAHILIDLLRTCSVSDLKSWSQEPRRLGRVPFGRHKGKAWSEPPTDYLTWLAAEPDMAQDVVDHARQELARRQLEGA